VIKTNNHTYYKQFFVHQTFIPCASYRTKKPNFGHPKYIHHKWCVRHSKPSFVTRFIILCPYLEGSKLHDLCRKVDLILEFYYANFTILWKLITFICLSCYWLPLRVHIVERFYCSDGYFTSMNDILLYIMCVSVSLFFLLWCHYLDLLISAYWYQHIIFLGCMPMLV
jgi:hypothetical protein